MRSILKFFYEFPTSQGLLSFDEILIRSQTDPIFEAEFDHVVWYNTDQRQEAWANSLFRDQSAPCVHTLRGFEESLLAAMIGDSGSKADLRFASPRSQGFPGEVLGIDDMEDASTVRQEFLKDTDSTILTVEEIDCRWCSVSA